MGQKFSYQKSSCITTVLCVRRSGGGGRGFGPPCINIGYRFPVPPAMHSDRE